MKIQRGFITRIFAHPTFATVDGVSPAWFFHAQWSVLTGSEGDIISGSIRPIA